jgi:SAM-dependent methyltransferase
MNLIERIHGEVTYNRRVNVLCSHLSELIPAHARVLDVGCGDGLLASLIMQRRPDIQIEGVDILVRPRTHIPVQSFDGKAFPYRDASFDAVMFNDVLHHTDDPVVLLSEARRVSRQSIVLKDHTRDGWLAGPTLRFMDWVGNARHGVVLPYNFWPERQWLAAFDQLKLSRAVWKQDLGLYPTPANLFFDRSLHFVARLDLN